VLAKPRKTFTANYPCTHSSLRIGSGWASEGWLGALPEIWASPDQCLADGPSNEILDKRGVLGLVPVFTVFGIGLRLGLSDFGLLQRSLRYARRPFANGVDLRVITGNASSTLVDWAGCRKGLKLK